MPARPTTRRFTGWGHATGSVATLVHASGPAEVGQLVRRAGAGGLLARGLGRAYGDAATNAGGLLVAPLQPDAPLAVDTSVPEVSAPAGVSFARLLRELLPQGLMLPVVPGTRYVTLGGAIAADVHGKNHHRDGSLGAWVNSLTLVDGLGEARRLSPDAEPDLFRATVGGMGLTGIVTDASLRLLRVSSSSMTVTTTKLDDFDELLSLLSADPGPRYQVAWVDCLAPGRRRYRAVLDEGEHAPAEAARHRRLRSEHTLATPAVPLSLVGRASVRAFNAAWWAKAPRRRTGQVPLERFFFPLDGARDWHRVYGPRGFLQYQLVVPLAAGALLRRVLDRLLAAGGVPALVVLKRMGAASGAPLSFPFPGWTLAVDLPVGPPALFAALRQIDEEVAAAGGRVYLAKDARLRPEALAAMYPRLGEWRAARERLDPHHRFASDLSRRIRLC